MRLCCIGRGKKGCVVRDAAEKDTLVKLRRPPMVNVYPGWLSGSPSVAINLTGGGWVRSRYDN